MSTLRVREPTVRRERLLRKGAIEVFGRAIDATHSRRLRGRISAGTPNAVLSKELLLDAHFDYNAPAPRIECPCRDGYTWRRRKTRRKPPVATDDTCGASIDSLN